jgi:hypothetical protein
VSLDAKNRLSIEQDGPLPQEILKQEKRSGVSLEVERSGGNRAVYILEQTK